MKRPILFLAANPPGMSRLALDEECAAIDRELRLTSGRDDFALVSRWAVSVDDLMRHLNELSPTVLHFSGHGVRGAAPGLARPGAGHRDIESPHAAGIVLQDSERAQVVSEHALARMIASASPATRLVVLNACHSNATVAALRQVVDCVIGVDGEIADDAARSFAVGLYRALGNHRSVGNAVSQAAATLYGKQLPGEIVTCHPRDGIHVDQMFLADRSTTPGIGEPSSVEDRVRAPRAASEPRISRTWPAAAGPYDLLLSHPPANRSSARALYDLLTPDLQVLLPGESELPRGGRSEQAIATSPRAARATVLLISSQSDAAWYLGDELLTAIALHHASPAAHRLVPVLLETGLPVPHCLGGIEAIDATAVGLLPGVADRLRAQVAALHRVDAPWIMPPAEPALHRGGSCDHFRLYERLGRLSDAVFEQIVAQAGINPAWLSSRDAALATRALDIAQLAALDATLCRRISAELDRKARWTRR